MPKVPTGGRPCILSAIVEGLDGGGIDVGQRQAQCLLSGQVQPAQVRALWQNVAEQLMVDFHGSLLPALHRVAIKHVQPMNEGKASVRGWAFPFLLTKVQSDYNIIE